MVLLSLAATGHTHVFHCTNFSVGLPDEQGEQKDALAQQAGSSTGMPAGQLAAGHVSCMVLALSRGAGQHSGLQRGMPTRSSPFPVQRQQDQAAAHIPALAASRGRGHQVMREKQAAPLMRLWTGKLTQVMRRMLIRKRLVRVQPSTISRHWDMPSRAVHSTRCSCTLHRHSCTELLVCSPGLCGLI